MEFLRFNLKKLQMNRNEMFPLYFQSLELYIHIKGIIIFILSLSS